MTFLGQSKTQSPVAGGAGIQQPVTDPLWSKSTFHSPGFLSSLALRIPRQKKASQPYTSSSRYNSFYSLTYQFSPTFMGEIVLAAQMLYSYVICTKIMFTKPDPGKKCYQKGCDLIENRGVVWEMKFNCLSRYRGTELTEMAISQRFFNFIHMTRPTASNIWTEAWPRCQQK